MQVLHPFMSNTYPLGQNLHTGPHFAFKMWLNTLFSKHYSTFYGIIAFSFTYKKSKVTIADILQKQYIIRDFSKRN